MGDAGYAALSGEVAVTLQLQPYQRRIFAVAVRR
jgi:hypothetical protein